MAFQNVVSVTHGVTTITGITSISLSTEDSIEPVFIDNDQFNSCVNVELGATTIEVTGRDLEQLQALDSSAAADLVIEVAGFDGTGNIDITLENAIGHSFTVNTPEPGGLTDATLSFTGKGDTGAASGLTIIDTP